MRLALIFIKIFLVCLLIAVLFFTALLFIAEHQSVVSFLQINYSGIYDSENIGAYFTENRFLISRYTFSAISIIYFSAIIYFRNQIHFLAEGTSKFLSGLKELLKKTIAIYINLKPLEKFFIITLFAITTIHKLLKVYEFPFEVDEVFSYVFFVSEGFWVSMVYYPEPNNHILYNLLCNFCNLFTDNPILIMRLPSFFVFILLIILLFAFLKRVFNFQTAILAVALSAFSYPITFYSLQGRGYLLMSLCTLIAIFAMFKMVNSKDYLLYKIIFIFSSIAGAYTIPVFLIPFSGIVAYGVINTLPENRALAKNIFYSLIIIGAAVLILYLPVILFNGPDAIVGNKWVKSKGLEYFFHILPVAIAESIDYLLNVEGKGYLFAAGISVLLIFIYLKEDATSNVKKWIRIFFIFLISGFLMLIILRVFPPYRVWTYLIFIYHIILAIGIIYLLNLIIKNDFIKKITLAAMCLLIILSGIAAFPSLDSKKIFYSELNRTINYIYQKDPSSIFIENHDLAEYYLRLKYKTEKKKIAVDVQQHDPEKKYQFLILYSSPITKKSWLSGYRKLPGFEDAQIFEKSSVGNSY